ncbi:hypothetical protein EAH81_05010 [Flavobacterium pectinovorum]|uniref:Uncharacterized protein n=1 Tax=Flavobacterium pectinovorum TaxID=29533 RepID=A0A502F3V2_9FLAO|nr:hypothetical protein EAH81_05010 [Flavobacterium pectinovorum]
MTKMRISALSLGFRQSFLHSWFKTLTKSDTQPYDLKKLVFSTYSFEIFAKNLCELCGKNYAIRQTFYSKTFYLL